MPKNTKKSSFKPKIKVSTAESPYKPPQWMSRPIFLYIPLILVTTLLVAVIIWRIVERKREKDELAARLRRQRLEALEQVEQEGLTGEARRERMEELQRRAQEAVDEFSEDERRQKVMGKKKLASKKRKEDQRAYRDWMLQQQQERLERKEMLEEQMDSNKSQLRKRRERLDESELAKKTEERAKLQEIRKRRDVLEEEAWKRRRQLARLYPQVIDHLEQSRSTSVESLCLEFGLEYAEAMDMIQRLKTDLPVIEDDYGQVHVVSFDSLTLEGEVKRSELANRLNSIIKM